MSAGTYYDQMERADQPALDHRPDEDTTETGPRVLHLGMVVRDRSTVPVAVPPLPPTYSVCYGGGEAYLGAGSGSFRMWGNTDDPDEDHTDDGTRHVVVPFEDGIPGSWTEDELADYLHRTFRYYLDDCGSGWRAADYVVWTGEEWSENARIIVCA